MAATLTPDGELTYFSFPIEKSEETADGDLIVYGKATDGTVDSDLQIVDSDWSGPAIQEWLESGGNIRIKHQARRDPAGKGLGVEITPEGHYVRALVVEPVAKELVKKGVLTAYSVGITHPDIVSDPSGKAMNGIIKGRRDGLTKISEISLVDRGSNFNSKFQLVKTAGDGAPELVGKMLDTDDVMYKGAGMLAQQEANVDLSLPKDVSVSFSPADLAKLLNHKKAAIEAAVVEKRDMDPDVGGGVDRDKIPAEDFAGRNRSFPIVTPGDVSDAASSIGRAGDDNYSSDKLKENITRIAHRKGDSFVAELPESWKKGDAEKADKTHVPDHDDASEDDDEAMEDSEKTTDSEMVKDKKAKKGKKKDKPFPGAHEQFSEAHQDNGHEEDEDSEKSVVVKKDKVICTNCGANIDKKHNFCPECGKKVSKDALDVKKNHDFTCLDCGNNLDKGEKFCPNCGKKNPGYIEDADSQIEANKSHCPTPTEGVEETQQAEPVPMHREPDGPAIEEFEVDAHMEEGDEDKEMAAAQRLKTIGVPMELGKLHDALCSCYHPDDVSKAYPTFDFADLDTNYWQEKAFDAATTATLEEAQKASQLWQHAITLKSAAPGDVLELRSDAYKSFADANPGPGSFPTPSQLSPTQYHRGYVTADHAAPSPGHDNPNSAPHASGQIMASQFTHDYVQTGHASDSPGNEDAHPNLAPSQTGKPQRVFYANVQRENARQAMSAMHDHIAQTFPDLCPAYTAAGPYNAEDLPSARPVNPGVGGPVPHAAPGVGKANVEPEIEKGKKKGKKAKGTPKGAVEEAIVEAKDKPEMDDVEDTREHSNVKKSAEPEVTKAATLTMDMISDIVTKAVASAVSERDGEIAKLNKLVKKQSKQIDSLASQPDPNSPYRGLALDSVSKFAGAPVGQPVQKSYAERSQENMIALLNEQIYDNDPTVRQNAFNTLVRMGGLNR